MSAQMADVVVIDDDEWAIVEPEPGVLFEPRDHGIHPVSSHSANTRGVLARYRFEDEVLVLSDLQVGHIGPPPALGGVEASTDEHERVWTYLDVDVPVRWTGDLVVGADPIIDLHVHAGFAPIWHYRRVLALDLEMGTIDGREDRTAEVARYRDDRTDAAARGDTALSDDDNAFERLLKAIRIRLPGGD